MLAWADNLIELKTICHCGKKANRVLRINRLGIPIITGKQIEIGGNEKYISVCRKHYTKSIKKQIKIQKNKQHIKNNSDKIKKIL